MGGRDRGGDGAWIGATRQLHGHQPGNQPGEVRQASAAWLIAGWCKLQQPTLTLNRQSPVILPPSRTSYPSSCCRRAAASSGVRTEIGPVKPSSLYCSLWAGVSTACCCRCCPPAGGCAPCCCCNAAWLPLLPPAPAAAALSAGLRATRNSRRSVKCTVSCPAYCRSTSAMPCFSFRAPEEMVHVGGQQACGNAGGFACRKLTGAAKQQRVWQQRPAWVHLIQWLVVGRKQRQH